MNKSEKTQIYSNQEVTTFGVFLKIKEVLSTKWSLYIKQLKMKNMFSLYIIIISSRIPVIQFKLEYGSVVFTQDTIPIVHVY